jgi:iron complex transport system ATP-binding protein
MTDHAAILCFDGVDLDRLGVPVLRGVNLEVGPGQRWVVLGPNGSGKTTMVTMAAGYLHPTRGQVVVLGERLGRVDVRRLRERIGLVSASVAKALEPSLTAAEIVLAARHGALEPWWHSYDPAERARAHGLLDAAGFGHIASRPWRALSEGERQQVLLARSLMASPSLLLLDEPAAGLDIAGRERLVARLAGLATEVDAPPTVLVTHHVEEVPPGFTHALVLRAGEVVASGPLEEALRGPTLSAAYGMELRVERTGQRWSCRAR